MGRPRTRPLPSPTKQAQMDLRKIKKANAGNAEVGKLCDRGISQLTNLRKRTEEGKTEAVALLRKNLDDSSNRLAELLAAAGRG